MRSVDDDRLVQVLIRRVGRLKMLYFLYNEDELRDILFHEF